MSEKQEPNDLFDAPNMNGTDAVAPEKKLQSLLVTYPKQFFPRKIN